MRRIILVCLLLLPTAVFAQSASEKQATLKFLYDLQQTDGGFVAGPDSKSKSSLRATSAAVRAIKYFGGELPNKDSTIRLVQSCYDRSIGAFADEPNGKFEVNTTAIGLMAAMELDPKKFDFEPANRYLANNAKSFEERRLAVAGMEATKHFAPVIEDWFAEIDKTANADGTFGKGDGQARETGGIVAMFLRAGRKLPDDQRKAMIAALQKGQRPDGGFGKAGEKASDGETTYRVMRAFHLLGEKPKNVAKLKDFLAKCRNADGGYGVAPGQPSTVSGAYYAAIIAHWLEK
jgi:prenyltransferase beta subunit